MGLEEAIMKSCPAISNWQLLISREQEKDKLTFIMEAESNVDSELTCSELYANLNRVNEDLGALIRSNTIHPIELEVVKQGTIERKGGKIPKIRDTRVNE
jgi:phenylacetate-coenzyme A ligase PaaK-like adenylate-forming protein